MNESKIDNYIERMQQPLISANLKEEFKNVSFAQVIICTENKQRNRHIYGLDFLVKMLPLSVSLRALRAFFSQPQVRALVPKMRT